MKENLDESNMLKIDPEFKTQVIEAAERADEKGQKSTVISEELGDLQVYIDQEPLFLLAKIEAGVESPLYGRKIFVGSQDFFA